MNYFFDSIPYLFAIVNSLSCWPVSSCLETGIPRISTQSRREYCSISLQVHCNFLTCESSALKALLQPTGFSTVCFCHGNSYLLSQRSNWMNLGFGWNFHIWKLFRVTQCLSVEGGPLTVDFRNSFSLAIVLFTASCSLNFFKTSLYFLLALSMNNVSSVISAFKGASYSSRIVCSVSTVRILVVIMESKSTHNETYT